MTTSPMTIEAKLSAMEQDLCETGLCDSNPIAQTALRALRVAVEMCSVNGYTTWDKSMVPMIDGKYDEKETNQWEINHGHDIRLKCFPEFGCQLLIDPEDLLTEIAKEMGI